MRVFCYGASGHGKVVADILQLTHAELLGFIDDDRGKAGTCLMGIPVLGTASRLDDLTGAAAIVSIGCNRVRTQKAGELERRGFRFATAVHPSAIVARDVSVGPGTVIAAGAVVNSGTVIGAHAVINTGATVDHDCVLAEGVHISPGASLAGGVRAGRNSQVGVRASVIQGIQIGSDAVIGAGAVVIRDIPSGVTAVGTPARPRNREGDLAPAKAKVLVGPHQSIREAIKAIDASGLAIALVVDSQRRLLGTVTDGDVRRAVLRGIDTGLPVSTIMNRNPVTVSPVEDLARIRDLLLASTLKHAIVTDERNQVVDLVTWADVLSLASRESGSQGIGSKPSGRPAVADFEQRVAACAGRRYAVAANSGAAALHVLGRALRLTENDEVVTTPLLQTFSDDWLAREPFPVRYIDVDSRTYNLDPEGIEGAITHATKAILAADTFGQPADYDRIEEIARRHGLDFIIDARQSLGAEYKHRRAAACGRAAVLGFDSGALVTTGNGGAIVTDDEALAESCRSLAYYHRLPELNCAFGLPQLERLEENLEQRRRLAETYDRLLENVHEVVRPCAQPTTTRISWHAYPVCLNGDWDESVHGQILARLRLDGIFSGLSFSAAALQALKTPDSVPLPAARAAASAVLALPFHNHVHADEAEQAVRRLAEAIAAVCGKRAHAHA